MEKRMNPFSDMGFKRIFGQDYSKDLLIDFLNSLLEGERKITDIRFLDKERVRRNVDDRSLIYDVFCQTDTGEKIIVEMQNKVHRMYKKRTIYYLSRAITDQAEPGEFWDFDIAAVYCISLMNFTTSEMPRKFRTDVALMDMETGELFATEVRLIYLQLPLFKKKELEECETNFEKWIFVLKHMDILERLPFPLQGEIFKKLAKITDVTSLSKEERREYDRAMREYWNTALVINSAKLDGHDEGFVEGREEGREERNLELAKIMKQTGSTNEYIHLCTGLPLEEIEKL
jgi:predicted transposase/invertase (TIGR01784 family)